MAGLSPAIFCLESEQPRMVRTIITGAIAGLDPAIHAEVWGLAVRRRNFQTRRGTMDARVKPAHDEGERCS
jgi:hypothetical protein